MTPFFGHYEERLTGGTRSSVIVLGTAVRVTAITAELAFKVKGYNPIWVVDYSTENKPDKHLQKHPKFPRSTTR